MDEKAKYCTACDIYIRIKFIEFESEWTQLAIVHKNNDK